MQSYAITNNLTPFISMQNHYNVLYREEEREMVPTLKHFGVGSIPWSPLARGLATRPWNAGSKRQESDPLATGFYSDSSEVIVGCVEKLAKEKGVSMAQVSLAWVLSKDAVSAPICGTTRLSNLEDLVGRCLCYELSDSFDVDCSSISWR
jgi:aryl-alcohol dehydrogenase-like predicted oxidoreductase